MNENGSDSRDYTSRVNAPRASFDFFNALIYHNYRSVCIYIPTFCLCVCLQLPVLRIFSVYGNLA